jgi:tetratricopeptide (TPR) repeat protein
MNNFSLEQVEEEKDLKALLKSHRLTVLKAKQLEFALSLNPDMKELRLQLTAFYFKRGKEFASKRADHLLWLIDNHPRSRIWGYHPRVSVDSYCPPKHFASLRERWLGQVDSFPHDAGVAGNAGVFLIDRDFETGDKLLSRAISLQPDDYYWSCKALYYSYLKTEESLPIYQAEYAAAALKHGKQVLSFMKSEKGGIAGVRLQALNWCAISALRARQFDKAKEYASMVLEEFPKAHNHPKWTHSILGLVAIETNDWAEAEKQLLTMRGISHTEEIDLELANKFVESGKTTVVIKYLQKCKEFGHWNYVLLDKWLETAAMGKTLQVAR